MIPRSGIPFLTSGEMRVRDEDPHTSDTAEMSPETRNELAAVE